MSDDERGDFYPCGCLVNSRGAHRGDCPDYETVQVGEAHTDNRLDDYQWKRRDQNRGELTVTIRNDLAAHIHRASVDYPRLHPRRVGAVVAGFLYQRGLISGAEGGDETQNVIGFVAATVTNNNAMYADDLADAVVDEFNLDEENRRGRADAG